MIEERTRTHQDTGHENSHTLNTQPYSPIPEQTLVIEEEMGHIYDPKQEAPDIEKRSFERVGDINTKGITKALSTASDETLSDAATQDDMINAAGEHISKKNVVRIGIGFTLCATTTAVAWTSLTSLILPRTCEIIDPANKVTLVGSIIAIGSIVALVANILFGALSDMTRSRFGKRSPWILGGAVLTGIAMGGIAFVHTTLPIILLWCLAQCGFNMMLAPYVAVMSDRVPEKMRGTVSSYYGAGGTIGVTLGTLMGAQLLEYGNTGVFASWILCMGLFILSGIFVLVVWPKEPSNCTENQKKYTITEILQNFCPPRHAPDFYRALVGRTLMLTGYYMVINFQYFIVQDYIFANDPEAALKAPRAISTIAIITLVTSLLAAVVSGPISDRIKRRKLPVALASCMFAVGAAMLVIFPSETGLYCYAVIAGFGFGVYNAIDQALNMSVLPTPEDAGKDLGILNLSNTLSTAIGPAIAGGIAGFVGATSFAQSNPRLPYLVIFATTFLFVIMAAVVIMRIKKVK